MTVEVDDVRVGLRATVHYGFTRNSRPATLEKFEIRRCPLYGKDRWLGRATVLLEDHEIGDDRPQQSMDFVQRRHLGLVALPEYRLHELEAWERDLAEWHRQWNPILRSDLADPDDRQRAMCYFRLQHRRVHAHDFPPSLCPICREGDYDTLYRCARIQEEALRSERFGWFTAGLVRADWPANALASNIWLEIGEWPAWPSAEPAIGEHG